MARHAASASFVVFAFLVACGAPPPSAPVPAPRADAALPPSSARREVVRGRVLDEAGRPLALAHARLFVDGKPRSATRVGADGGFEIALEGAPAVVELQVTGIDRPAERVLLSTREAPIEVMVRLGTFPAGDGSERPKAIVTLATVGMKSVELEKQPDGTFAGSVEAPDGTHRYQLVETDAGGHSTNGTTREALEAWTLDDGGDYVSVVTAAGGRAQIVFDPTKRPRPDAAPEIRFSAPTSESAALTAIAAKLKEAQRAFGAKAKAARLKGEPPLKSGAADAYVVHRRELAEIERREARTLVKNAAAIAIFAGPVTESESELARAVLGRVAPDDPLWGVFGSVGGVLRAAGSGGDAEAYAAAFVERNANVNVVARYLFEQVVNGEPARARAALAALRAPRFAATVEQRVANAYDPDRPLAPGRVVPPFAFKALVGGKVDAKAEHTARSLAGKVYLIEVWATWCAPCVAELPKIHELVAKYGAQKGRGFTVLSVSIDEKPESVVAFRKAKEHPMPWLHGWAGGQPSALQALTGSNSPPVPFYALVGADGKVIASSPQLHVAELPRLLARALETAAGP